MSDVKSMDEHIERLDKTQHEEQTPLPEAISGYSHDELRKLGRKATIKLDLVIMPAMVILYILNYLDRQNIAASNLADITVDLGLSVTQYNTTVSILFVGYSKSYASISMLETNFVEYCCTVQENKMRYGYYWFS
jgi:hypothetical protein